MAEPTNPAGEAQPQPDPNQKLVKVFDSELESEALVVKGLLDSAGIDSDMRSASLVQDAFPMGGMLILVREEDADEARRVIAEGMKSAATDDDATAEYPAIEQTPPKA